MTQRIFKYKTGEVVPQDAKYLCSVRIEGKTYHYFLAEVGRSGR